MLLLLQWHNIPYNRTIQSARLKIIPGILLFIIYPSNASPDVWQNSRLVQSDASCLPCLTKVIRIMILLLAGFYAKISPTQNRGC